MDKAGVHLDNDLLVHMVLYHLPLEYLTTQQVIIATAEESDTALTLTGVLSQIHKLIRDHASVQISATTLNTKTQSNSN